MAGSSSSAAVGKTVARHAIEPRSSHGRHGGRERRGYLPCRREAPSWRSFFGALVTVHAPPPAALCAAGEESLEAAAASALLAAPAAIYLADAL